MPKTPTLIAAAAFAVAGLFAGNADATPVDVELQLLVDTSGSVSGSEFALQRNGYADAFRSGNIQDAILDTDSGNRFGSVAVQFIYWAGSSNQAIGVDWTLLDSTTAIDDFADAIEATSRPFNGSTAPGSAINFGAPLFATNGFDGTTQVMDVSGDGTQNAGANTAAARDAALAAGIDRINGLPIGGSSAVEAFYMNTVIGGTGAFSLPASSFADFGDAVALKLAAEITGMPPGGPSNVIPLPAGAWLLFSGLGAIGVLRARRAA